MTKKSIKTEIPDPVVPLEIPFGSEDPFDLGEDVQVGMYFNTNKNYFRIGVVQPDSSIKWGGSGIVWDVSDTPKKQK